MPFVHSGVVDVPVPEVFAWHTRPGALVRLAPPWQPVRIATESGSLRDGSAVLALPGGLRWGAQHVPDAYDPPHRFADELVSWPLRAALSWRHIHDFTATDGGTRITDRIDTTMPKALLRPMFEYRHRQLADDLATHRRFRAAPWTIGITEPAGVLGCALAAFLTTGGHRVLRLVPRFPAGAGQRRWRPADPDPGLLDGLDGVVHLASGCPVSATRRLAEVAANTPRGPQVFVVASAIDVDGTDSAEERAARAAADAGLRVVSVRAGHVQSARTGMLRALRPWFAAGLGHHLGSGREWISWIGFDDLVDVYYRALVDGTVRGPLNAVAPEPVRTHDYARTLGRVLRRPAALALPESAAPPLPGPRATDRSVLPQRLLAHGHHFRHPRLEQALRHQLGRFR